MGAYVSEYGCSIRTGRFNNVSRVKPPNVEVIMPQIALTNAGEFPLMPFMVPKNYAKIQSKVSKVKSIILYTYYCILNSKLRKLKTTLLHINIYIL